MNSLSKVRALLRFGAGVSVAAAMMLLGIPSAHGRQSGTSAAPAPDAVAMEALAAKMAKGIAHSKQKNVVVFDFVGPEQNPTALGEMLTDEFSAALAKKIPKLRVVGRTTISEQFAKWHVDPLAAVVAPCTGAVIDGLAAKICISGHFAIKGGELTVTTALTEFRDLKKFMDFERIGESSMVIPLSPEMIQASEKILLDDRILDYPQAEEDGHGMPSCLICPHAFFTDEALHHNTQGLVLLLVVIGEDGAAKEIKVLKGLPDGLTESAVQSVRDWKFKPATGDDGKPRATRTPIEVQFHLTHGPL